jgi:hypothetical protein
MKVTPEMLAQAMDYSLAWGEHPLFDDSTSYQQGNEVHVTLKSGVQFTITVSQDDSGPVRVYCFFCNEYHPPMHVIGAAKPGSNPWCCDNCWDERLR